MATSVFIGACFIIDEVGPSDLATAPRVFTCVMYMKMPVIVYSMKSPRTAAPRIFRMVNIAYMTRTRTTDWVMFTSSPRIALWLDLRMLRTAA